VVYLRDIRVCGCYLIIILYYKISCRFYFDMRAGQITLVVVAVKRTRVMTIIRILFFPYSTVSYLALCHFDRLLIRYIQAIRNFVRVCLYRRVRGFRPNFVTKGAIIGHDVAYPRVSTFLGYFG